MIFDLGIGGFTKLVLLNFCVCYIGLEMTFHWYLLFKQRANHGPVDHFAHNSAAMRNGSVDEHSEAQAMSNIQRAVEPEFGREFAYNRGTEHPAGSPMPAVPLNIPLQPFACPPGRSIPPTENLACQAPGSSAADCGMVNNEGRTFESGSSSGSGVYSQV